MARRGDAVVERSTAAVAMRKLFRQFTADLPFACCFLPVAGAGVDGYKPQMCFKVFRVGFNDLLEQFAAAFCVSGFGECTAKRELGHDGIWRGIVGALGWLKCVAEPACDDEGEREKGIGGFILRVYGEFSIELVDGESGIVREEEKSIKEVKTGCGRVSSEELGE